tara:strand:+ start:301 stop:741 length:441 start_codon:yes stop_codon:yes gene_type:complete
LSHKPKPNATSISLGTAISFLSQINSATEAIVEKWVAIGYAILTGRFTAVQLVTEAELKGTSLNRGQLSKAVKVARLLNENASVRAKYENNQIVSFEALYGMCPKKATSRTVKKMELTKAKKVLLSSSAFKALPKESQVAIRKALA